MDAQIIKTVSDEAATKAVEQVFAILGVDVNDPESVEEFREDLRFGKRLRKTAEQGWWAIVKVTAVAIVGAFWYGVVSKVKGG